MFRPIFIHFATISGFWTQHEILLLLLILELNCLLQLIWIISCDKLGPSLCNNWTALFSGSVGALQGQGLPGAGSITWCPLHLVPLVFLATSSWDSFLLPGSTVAWHQGQCPMAPHLAIVPFPTHTDCNLILYSWQYMIKWIITHIHMHTHLYRVLILHLYKKMLWMKCSGGGQE